MMHNFSQKKKSSDGIRAREVIPAAKETMREDEEFLYAPPERVSSFAEEEGVIVSESAYKLPKEKARSRRLAVWGMVVGCAAVAAGAVAASTAGARLTLTLKPRIENVSVEDIAVHFDTAVAKVSAADKTIPAQQLTASKTIRKEFPATGMEDVSERARGKIKIYNQFSSLPQMLVKNTRFVTDTGALFRLSQGASVPGAKIADGKIVPQFIEAELIADGAGEKFNASGEIKLRIPGLAGSPKYDGFFAVAPEGFSGGASGTARVASPDDVARAQESVTKELFAFLEEEMRAKIPPELIYKDTFRDIQVSRLDGPQAHTPGEKFFVGATAAGRVLAFRESDVIAILKDFAVGSDGARALVDGSAALEYRVRNIDFDLGRADVLIRGSVKTSAVLPENELAALVAGKKEGSIADLLKHRADIGSFRLSFFPPWRSSAPDDPSKVRLIIQ